jgi:lysophospholipase L1-like esterase
MTWSCKRYQAWHRSVRLLWGTILVAILTGMSGTATADGTPEALDQFKSFLQSSLGKRPTDEGAVDAFYEHAFTFWNAHRLDYWEHPGHYGNLLALYYQAQAIYQEPSGATDLGRFKYDVEQFQRFDARNTKPARPVLFVGSSSIVFWETAVAFPEYPVINRGFGGASLPEVNHYYDQVVKTYRPAVIIVYCDIDVEMRKPPEAALESFREFSEKIGKDLPDAQIVFLSMKPTLMDAFLGKDVGKNKVIANRLFKAFAASSKNIHFVDVATPMLQADGRVKPSIFRDDGMHLNAQGYDLWNPIIRHSLAELYK